MDTNKIVQIVESHDFNLEELELLLNSLIRKKANESETTRETIEYILRGKAKLDGLSASYFSNYFNVSRKTLYRRLRTENTSISYLVDNERKRRCVELLRENSRNGVEISDALGFSEPAYFYQKFQKWTGLRFKKVKGEMSSNRSYIVQLIDVF